MGLDWQTYQRVQLSRLLRRLQDQTAVYAAARAWLLKYGYQPSDPLVAELDSLARHTVDLAEVLRQRISELGPYRPLVDPWVRQGLAAKLRPDFKARGIDDERQQ